MYILPLHEQKPTGEIGGNPGAACSGCRERVRNIGGELRWALGKHVTRDRKNRTLKLDQERYVQDLIDVFEMTDCKLATTPAIPGEVLPKTHQGEKHLETTLEQGTAFGTRDYLWDKGLPLGQGTTSWAKGPRLQRQLRSEVGRRLE